MTSECFVYVTLPGRTEAVTAARFEWAQTPRGGRVGRLVYGKRYLSLPDAVAIDPIELLLKPGVFETARMGGIFGALRDASPDFWGRRVIEKHAGKVGLSELDYLLLSADDRAGALSFGLSAEPPAPRRAFNQTLELGKLQALADQLLEEGGEGSPQVEELLQLGTSMGGARPKVVVEDVEGLWLAKFNRADDRFNVARVEHAMLELASECGLLVARSRVEEIGERDVLLVKRFDRQKTSNGYARARMVSALTLLKAGDSVTERTNWSYLSLAEELRRVSADPRADAAELFGRMCFNAMISNLDDHPRNHAVIAPKQDWRLSPAYDLVPLPQVSVERRDLALEVGDRGRWANRSNLLSQCERFLLVPEAAEQVVERIESVVRSRWYPVARAAGVSERDCEALSGCFGYPGFAL